MSRFTGRALLPPRRHRLLHALLALAAAALFFVLWGDVPVWDDAGFVLRYLDNFAAGHFYVFNPSDGPMFGLSSFLHGLLAGLLALSGILSAEGAMFASNFIGLTLLSFATLRLLARQGGPWWLVIAAWLVTIGAAPRLVINLKQGLETPLHAGVLAATLLAFFARNTRTTLLLAALCVASKLDLAPAALVLALLTVWRSARATEQPRRWRRAIVTFAVWFALPVGVVLTSTTLLFGSPLPQSAMAKFEFHQRDTGGWFPYLDGLRTMRSAVHMGLVLAVLHLGLALRARQRFDLALYAPAIVLLATLPGYWYYNPREQMGWYYAVPDFLIALQVVLLAYAIPVHMHLRGGSWWTVAAIALLAYFQLPKTEGQVRHTRWYERTCEAERIAMGEWIGQHAAPTDTLMTWFGHIGRSSRLYVLDETGLNSQTATEFGLDYGRLLQTHRPHWIARIDLLPIDLQRVGGYELVGSWYNFPVLIGYPTNRVYQRTEGDSLFVTLPVLAETIVSDGQTEGGTGARFVIAHGRQWSFPLPETEGVPQTLLCGVRRGEHAIALLAHAVGTAGESTFTWALTVPPLQPGPPTSHQTMEWRIDLPAGDTPRSMRIEATSASGSVRLIDPVLVARVERFRR